jgi:hypothetical protein
LVSEPLVFKFFLVSWPPLKLLTDDPLTKLFCYKYFYSSAFDSIIFILAALLSLVFYAAYLFELPGENILY